MNIKKLNEELKNVLNNNAKYLCFWDTECFLGGCVAFHDIDFFTEERGYSHEAIEEIKNLKEIGDVWESDVYGQSHLVIKVNSDIKFNENHDF